MFTVTFAAVAGSMLVIMMATLPSACTDACALMVACTPAGATVAVTILSLPAAR